MKFDFPLVTLRDRIGVVIGMMVLFLGLLVFGEETGGFHLLYLNWTGSLPRGIYIAIPGPVETGDYVAYDPPENVKQYADAHAWDEVSRIAFIKRVGAMGGEGYCVEDEKFFANGRYIGSVLAADPKGIPMAHVQGAHVVPEGEFLPFGTSTLSFDGRYTGTVPLSAVHSRVLPLLTE